LGEGRKGKSSAKARPVATVPLSRRVLLATDFSDLAACAVPWAYALAGPGGAVVLVHVHDPDSPPNPLYAHYEPGHTASQAERDERLAEIRDRLHALAPGGALSKGVATEVEVVENEKVVEGIREAAERRRVDAICLASHCRGRVGRTILGSTAEALLRDADTPVFIIPGPQD